MAIIAVTPQNYTTMGFPLCIASSVYSGASEQIFPQNQTIQEGDIVQLHATQQLYSFDYYAIYPPHTIYNAGALWFTTVRGFTASYDPNTVVKIGATVNITGSDSGIRAIYR